MTTQRDQPGDPGFRGDLGPRRPSSDRGGGGSGETPTQALTRLAQQLIDNPGDFISIRKEWMEITGLTAREAEVELDQAERSLRGETPKEVVDEETGRTAQEIQADLIAAAPETTSAANEGFFADLDDPRTREEGLQQTPGGRGQLFNEFVAPNLPAFGGGIAQRAAQQRFQPLQSQFLLNQGLLGEFAPFGEGELFSGGFGGGVPSGSDLRGLLGQLTDIIGNVGDQFDFSAPQSGFLEALSDPNTGRNTAFNIANTTFGAGSGNPFRNAFSNVLGRRFDSFLGGGGSPIDFLGQVAGGGGRLF